MYSYKSHRPTWVEIDLTKFHENFKRISYICGENIEIMGVVKADAYGHGAVEISHELTKLGVQYLAISNIDEAIELREAGITNPILLFGNVENTEFSKLIEYNIYPTITSYKYALELSKAYKYRENVLKVHIKIDTGMGRLGIPIYEAMEQIIQIINIPGLVIDGIYTHFPSADLDYEFSNYQIKIFKELIIKLKEYGAKIKYFHIANSAGLFNLPDSSKDPFNLVRIGLALYGCSTQKNSELKNIMSLKTKIMDIRKLTKGETVSYLRTYEIKDDYEYIAVLPVGYADGVPTSYSNKGKVLINNEFYPVVGRVCMDYMMVSLGKNLKNINEGDIATVFGQNAIRIEEFGEICGKIPYEVTCGISHRVPRIYLRKEDKK